MAIIKVLISILFILFSLNVWPEDSSAFELASEGVDKINKMGETELKMRFFIADNLISIIQSQQAINQAIGVTSDSKYIIIPQSMVLLLGAYYMGQLSWYVERGYMEMLSFVFQKKSAGSMSLWFEEYNKLVSQMVDESKDIFKLRREVGLKNKYYRLSSLPLGREIVRDVEGKRVTSVYKERIGAGLTGGKYQTLLDGVEKNLNIPDRGKKIRILKSLVQREKTLISLKTQLAKHLRTYPELTVTHIKSLTRSWSRFMGAFVSIWGMIGFLTIVGADVVIVLEEHEDLNAIKRDLQAEADYILYLLAQSSESDDSVAGF